MRVTFLKKNPKVYSCNVYHVRGNWNAIDDVNTLIDVGTDNYILDEIHEMTSTGVGKKRIEKIILTHEHFDHAGGLKFIIEEFKPEVIAFNKLNGVDIKAYNNMNVKIGDSDCVIIHTPGHSHDSICIYCEEDKILFSGDTAVNIKIPGGSYSKEFVEVIERLSRLDIRSIYSGHDNPIINTAQHVLKNSLRNVLRSKIID